jgi:predicted ATP-dependent serine protease
VRGVAQIESGLTEAARLGFKKAIIPQGNLSAVSRLPSDMMEILPVKTLGEAIGILVPA